MVHLCFRCLPLILIGLSLWIQPIPLHAQEPSPELSWQQALTCDPAQQAFGGMEYCTDDTGTLHVLVVDTYNPGVRLEYMIAEGVNSGGNFDECNDVNVPRWGKVRGGCADPTNPDYYPIITLGQAVELAQERHGQVAAVIDSDYGAGTQGHPGQFRGHGPEGLTVVRGVRIDGPVNGDTDDNAVRRPWLVASRNAPLRVELGQYAPGTDHGDKPYDWVYTGVGGSPWLVRNGVIQDEAIRICEGAPGSCYEGAEQTAVGLSRDRRWLFLVLDARGGRLIDLAHFLRVELAVWDAIKFDGGGSSQLWYGSQVIERGDGRQLSQYLAVVAGPGSGIEMVEPAPDPLPEEMGFFERMVRTLKHKVQETWDGVWSRLGQFYAEQKEQLQRSVERWMAERQAELQRWWDAQVQRLEREIERQTEGMLWQLCGGNVMIGVVVVGVVLGTWRQRLS